jgi:hypothetical protein
MVKLIHKLPQVSKITKICYNKDIKLLHKFKNKILLGAKLCKFHEKIHNKKLRIYLEQKKKINH